MIGMQLNFMAIPTSLFIREKAFREMKKRCRDDHCSKK